MNVREIKFRAFGNTNFSSEKMYSWEELLQKEYLLLNLIVECSEPHNAWKLMQFTGLHDKNGREIYEGDVVLTGKYEDKKDDIFVVRWAHCGFVFDPIDEELDLEEIIFHEKSEIIGNIYENPELVQP